MATFFFCGVGGIGMSAIALYLKKSGNTVFGSDRSFDAGKHNAVKESLIRAGITLVSQDGQHVPDSTDVFVVSSAVEESVPDVKAALLKGLTIKKRAEVLAEIFNQKTGIAVGGTSGKTTVTAMIGHILYTEGKNLTMINGGISLNSYNNEEKSNLIYGESDLCVIEADESDGSIQLYTPAVSVLTNISLDHKPIEEIMPLFSDFLNKAKKGAVLNADCPFCRTLSLSQPFVRTFSVSGKPASLSAQNVVFDSHAIRFELNGETYTLPFTGRHNLENALAAAAACQYFDIPVSRALIALMTFKGTKRRLQLIGIEKGVSVIDDYAHNPEKIKASIEALQLHAGRLFCVFQPHGFAPLRLMKDDLIHMLTEKLNNQTFWLMSDVYYAGGTTIKDISSSDIISALQKENKQAFYLKRDTVPAWLSAHVQSGDIVAVMGARDDTLTLLAQNILTTIKEKK